MLRAACLFCDAHRPGASSCLVAVHAGSLLHLLRLVTPSLSDQVLAPQWIGCAADGFPVLEGKAEEIKGKHFEIRKVRQWHPWLNKRLLPGAVLASA